MNDYTFDEITVGQTESFTATITGEMMQHFFGITGDSNPLHCDKDFAVSRGYSDIVVYGMLTASYLSTLVGVYLPGRNSVIHETDIKYPAPVFVGDVITFKGEVLRKNETYRIIEMKVSAVKDDGTKVLRGKMNVGVAG